MAQKLSITLALEGGAELQRQLKEIGTAGQKAFLDISKAAEQAGGFTKIDPSAVTAKFNEMGITSVAEINKIQDALQGAIRTEKAIGAVSALEDRFSSLRSVVQTVGVTFASVFNAALIQKAIGAVFKLAEAVSAVDTQAIKLGKNVEVFDQLRHGFAQMGIAAKTTADGIAKFDLSNVERAAKVLEEASKRGFGGFGTSEMAVLEAAAKNVGAAGDLARKTLEGLGQSVDNLDKKTDSTLVQFIERLSKLPDSAERTRLATSRLGEEMGTTMVQMLRAGASADSLKEKLAGTLTQEDANRANSLKLALTQLGDVWERFKNLIGVPAPLLQDIADITGALKGWSNLLDGSGGSWTNWYAVASQALLNAGQHLKDFGISIGNFVTTQIDGAWQWITDTFWSAVGGVQPAIETAKGWIKDFVTTPIGDAWQWIVDKWNAMLAKLGFGSGGSAPSGGGAAPQMMASGGMIGGRGTGTSDSNLAWVSRGEYIMPARAVRRPGMLALLEGLRGGGRSGSRGGLPAFAAGGSVGMVHASSINQIVEAFNSVAKSIADGFSVVAREETVQRGFEGMSRAFQSLYDAMRGHARGGLLGGRGTGTSDSNLAWVSRGEHIMPARAVAQPGVLAFLEALRRSGGNLSRVLDGMGRYAAGGLVMPSLVTAGSGGMSNVTIQFPGMPTIGGLRASSQVVEELQRAAAMAQVRSGGRKPSRYR